MIKAGEELLRLQEENKKLKEGIKQAREEIKATNDATYIIMEILDKLIAESEGIK